MQSSANRIREAMELEAQTVTMITAAVDETVLAVDSMSSTIAAIRSDTENVARTSTRSSRASAASPKRSRTHLTAKES